MAVLARILFKVGLDIIDWRFLKHLLQTPRTDVVIMGLYWGIKPGVQKVLDELGVLKQIRPEQHYDHRLDASRHADQESDAPAQSPLFLQGHS